MEGGEGLSLGSVPGVQESRAGASVWGSRKPYFPVSRTGSEVERSEPLTASSCRLQAHRLFTRHLRHTPLPQASSVFLPQGFRAGGPVPSTVLDRSSGFSQTRVGLL